MTKMLVALLVALVTAAPAVRADVRVTYTVQDRALKAAVSGTNLTFTLFSDGGCTMQIGSPITSTINNVALVERLKLFKPVGGTKAPATDRLTQVLSGVTPTGPVFLTVTGTGIAPVGGACQFQFVSGTPLPCATQVGTEVFFTGCNVNVLSGSGSTDGTVNGLGNLVIGYGRNTGAHARSGSHNLVVGDEHAYSSYAGLVAGFQNTISGHFASVTAGTNNTATGNGASVSGGGENTASSDGASVSGGGHNTAGGLNDAVSGGYLNTANGGFSSVTGGVNSFSTANYATVSGGENQVASGAGSSVSGGIDNTASGFSASVCGGGANLADGDQATISGGHSNHASNLLASISGGDGNLASGDHSSISGGSSLTAAGAGEWHSGQSASFPTGTEY